MPTLTYSVPDISCDHCVKSITGEVTDLSGIAKVDVDLTAKTVTVEGEPLDDAAIRAAIDKAGYKVA